MGIRGRGGGGGLREFRQRRHRERPDLQRRIAGGPCRDRVGHPRAEGDRDLPREVARRFLFESSPSAARCAFFAALVPSIGRRPPSVVIRRDEDVSGRPGFDAGGGPGGSLPAAGSSGPRLSGRQTSAPRPVTPAEGVVIPEGRDAIDADRGARAVILGKKKSK